MNIARNHAITDRLTKSRSHQQPLRLHTTSVHHETRSSLLSIPIAQRTPSAAGGQYFAHYLAHPQTPLTRQTIKLLSSLPTAKTRAAYYPKLRQILSHSRTSSKSYRHLTSRNCSRAMRTILLRTKEACKGDGRWAATCLSSIGPV